MKKYIVFLILTGLFGFGLMGQNEKVGKELMKVIKTRASVRQFADKPIEVEKVSHMLLDAGNKRRTIFVHWPRRWRGARR